MLSQRIILIVVLGFGLGGIAFGCTSGPVRQPPIQARAKVQPAVPAEPVPAPVPAWVPADMPETGKLLEMAPLSADQQVLPAGGQADDPALKPIATSEPAKPQAALDGPAKVRELHRLAAERYAGIDSYIVRLKRREVVGGSAKPEEIMLFKFRKQPWSVYFKWLGEEATGREAIYVKGKYDSKLHSLLAAGDMPFAPAGKRMALDPDSILVRARSRHTIHEAGIGHIIAEFGKALQAEDAGGQKAAIRYLGQVKRPEYEAPLDGTELRIAPGAELPNGGSRQIYFDPASNLPVLLITNDAAGKELEYFGFDRLQYPVNLDEDDFNPDKLWPPKK